MPATVTRDNHHCTCLGHLGRRDTDRIISVGQGKYIWCDIAGIIVRYSHRQLFLDIYGYSALNFANVNDPIEMVANFMQGILKGDITVPMTSCLSGLESAVWQLTIFVFICKTDQSTSQTWGQWYSDTSRFSIPCCMMPVYYSSITEWKEISCLFLTPGGIMVLSNVLQLLFSEKSQNC